jgi:hypothetical protein
MRMEVVIDYEVLMGLGNDPVVKQISLAAKNVSIPFIFKVPTPCTLTAMPKTVLTGTTAI